MKHSKVEEFGAIFGQFVPGALKGYFDGFLSWASSLALQVKGLERDVAELKESAKYWATVAGKYEAKMVSFESAANEWRALAEKRYDQVAELEAALKKANAAAIDAKTLLLVAKIRLNRLKIVQEEKNKLLARIAVAEDVNAKLRSIVYDGLAASHEKWER